MGVSSCSLIRVNGKPLGSSSQAGQSSAVRNTPGASANVPAPSGASPAEFWQNIHYSHVQDGEYPTQFFTRTGVLTLRDVTVIPKTVSSTWIPNWDSTSRAKRGAAFLESAVARSWQADCHKEFARQQASWKSILQDSQQDLDLVASTKNFYLGRTRIEALWRTFSTRAEAEQLYLPKGHPFRFGFGWNALAVSELKLRKNTGREKLASWALPQELYPETRPMPPSAGIGREAFCQRSKNGTSRLPAQPSLGGAGGGSEPSASPEEYAQAEQWLRSSSDWIARNWKESRAYSIGQGFVAWQHGGEGSNNQIKVSGLVVKNVSKRGKGATVKFVESGVKNVSSKCRRTNRVAQIHSNGRVEYEQSCLITKVKTAMTMSISFPDLPTQGVQVGDSLWAYGLVKKNKVTNSSKFKQVQSINAQGLHISGIERNGEKLNLYP
tara:strand:- start:23540 stop:24853 length:1314 start_codon:yes stop_codon:yes gene_type:complete